MVKASKTSEQFFRRLASAVRRRIRYVRRLLGRRPTAREELALAWLLSMETGDGLRAGSSWEGACPGLTGAAIETAISYGCRKEAIRWARWLMTIQRADGAMPDVTWPGEASARCTAQAAAGLLAILPELPEAEDAARRACQYLCEWLNLGKGSAVPSGAHAPAGPHSGKPPDVLPLVEASRHWPETGWLFEVSQIVDHGIHRPDVLAPFVGLEQSSARRVETLLAMDRRHTARQILEQVGQRQRRRGGLGREWPSTARLAQLAMLWYQVGQRDRADRALSYLERIQRRNGSFPARAGWLVPRRFRQADTWTAKYYLDAALWRVRAAFEVDWQDLPQEIDAEDGRMRAVYNWFSGLPIGAKVADVGCGKGRFVRHLVRYFPAAELVGIDISPMMLSFLPPGVTAQQGSLLRTGASDGEFDGVLAVESLEHALVPERAVAELCRIVRPGGQILVIDKDRRKEPLSEHEPWERWVAPEELVRWLAPYCQDIAIRHVSHAEGRAARDLFLAATGVRRA